MKYCILTFLNYRMSEVEKWLEDIDMEEYTDRFIELGAKKVKHFKDIEEKHLKEMEMKELEIKRFLQKRALSFGTLSEPSKSDKKVVYVPLPSSVFGHYVTEISEEKLKKTYAELYYIPPVNMKQRYLNSFTLKMCSAAKWGFDSKKKTFRVGKKGTGAEMDL